MERNRSGSEQTVVREIFEPCCVAGAHVEYRGLTLIKLEWPDSHGLWRVERDDEYLETINTNAFRSVGELAQFLDALADDNTPTDVCVSCPLRSVPGD